VLRGLHVSPTDRLARSDLIFLQINLLGLLVVAFLPFPTRLVAAAPHNGDAERVAVTLYGLTLLAISALGSALDAYARQKHLHSPREDGDEDPAPRRRLLPVLIQYVIVIVIGLVLPKTAVALYCSIAVYSPVTANYLPAFVTAGRGRW
jgi:uncharacterized membrane protein